MDEIVGVAAGVPYVARPPAGPPNGAPLLVAWHMHDPPRTEKAMAAALPLNDLPAWRVYLGLPLSGSRLPEGGHDAFLRLSYEDAVLNVFGPVCRQAVDEFLPALSALREALPGADGPLGLIGGSVGALVALSVLAETDLPVKATALISPAIRLAAVVGLNERRFDVTYEWSDRSRAVAQRLDFVARAREIARRHVAMLMVVGALDDVDAIHKPAEQLWQMLSGTAPERTALATIPDMAHALAAEPGVDPAPQTPPAARVDAVVTEWFHRHLTGSPRSGVSLSGR